MKHEIEQLFETVEKNSNNTLMCLLSWSNPQSVPSATIRGIEDLKQYMIDLCDLRPSLIKTGVGTFNLRSEESALLVFDNIKNHIEAMDLVDSLILIGKNLGQYCIITSTIKSNVMWNCQSGHADLIGQGYQKIDESEQNNIYVDKTSIDGFNFKLNLGNIRDEAENQMQTSEPLNFASSIR